MTLLQKDRDAAAHQTALLDNPGIEQKLPIADDGDAQDEALWEKAFAASQDTLACLAAQSRAYRKAQKVESQFAGDDQQTLCNIMNIPYMLRSKFVIPCEEIITAQQERLDAGQRISVALEAGGYPADVGITLHPADEFNIEDEWASSDPTRFPVRVRAAATALKNCGNVGCFSISHADGTLSIQRKGP